MFTSYHIKNGKYEESVDSLSSPSWHFCAGFSQEEVLWQWNQWGTVVDGLQSTLDGWLSILSNSLYRTQAIFQSFTTTSHQIWFVKRSHSWCCLSYFRYSEYRRLNYKSASETKRREVKAGGQTTVRYHILILLMIHYNYYCVIRLH